MDYENLKKKFEENKPKLILGVCFIVVFLVGFGTGRFERQNQNPKIQAQNDYTKNSKVNPENTTPTAQPQAQVLSASTTPKDASGSCLIKGNISSKGEKIYHIPGGSSYKIVKPEQCFNTEKEAQAAGFRKALR